MKKKSVNQKEIKAPVRMWIAPRKNRWAKPSVKEEICAHTLGAKCQISPTIKRRALSCDSFCLRVSKEIEDDAALYVLVYLWLASNSISEIKRT